MRLRFRRFQKLRREDSNLRHLMEDLVGDSGEVTDEVPKGGEVFTVVPVGVGPVAGVGETRRAGD